MASIVLRAAGAAIGSAIMPGIGTYIGAQIGGALGNVVDAQLGLGSVTTGPRLENLAVQDSRYGAGIPIVYGNARVGGNVIWSTRLIETQHSDRGGKGSGVTTKTYTYSTHCAIGICAGPIAGINTIWADNTVIYENGVWTSGLFDNVTIYTGSGAQAPDSFMESILGSGNVPSYRGLAYIVFENLQLDTFGSRLPNLTFEIAAASSTTDPSCLGTVDAGLSQRAESVKNGTMAPLVLQKNGAQAIKVLVGGFAPNGSTATFVASTYDVTGNTPVLLSKSTSAAFAASNPSTDSAWALSPDGRFVAFYLQNALALSHTFAIYDTETQAFGTPFPVALPSSSTLCKQLAWVDAQHFVIDDIAGGVRGLHVFARAGTSIIDLGFTGLWGSSSATTTSAFYGAQFTPYADGLLAYNFVTSPKTLRARTVAWRGNALSLGPHYTIASGLTLGTGSGMHGQFVKTASDEWTLAIGTVAYYRLMSFEPAEDSAAITRPWQLITPPYGTDTTNYPVAYGDRLLIVQNPVDGNHYGLSEVLLGEGSFSAGVNAAPVGNLINQNSSFAAIKLDSARLLFMGMGGSSYDIRQLAIIERNARGSVASVLSDILSRAGYEDNDFDISALTETLIQGYVLQDAMSARNAIEPLQAYAAFDLIETDGQLKAVRRGGSPAAVIYSEETRAAADGKEQPPEKRITRAQEMDLPREVAVEVVDPSRNFEVNCQRARRRAGSARAIQKLSLPVICNAETAKQIAETKLYTAWAERELIKLFVSRAWLALDASDVIELGDGGLMRIAAINQSGGLIKIEGFTSYASSLSSSAVADGGQSIGTGSNKAVATVLYLLDLPLLQEADDQPGLYIAATGIAGWKGASVYRSSDTSTYNNVASITRAAVAGAATTTLANGSPFYMDRANAVSVQMTQGTLSSCSEADLMNGANAAVVGNEIIQFQNATLVGPGLYTLSNLLRGRRGTEDASSTHAIGETFVLLQPGAVTFLPDTLGDRNNTFYFKGLSNTQSLGDAHNYAFTYGFKTLCPFAPVHINASRSLGTSGDLTITWVRRARLDAEWVDYIDVPLDEPEELYEADIMNGAAIVRAFTGLTSPTVTYTSAQQSSDWGGSIPQAFTVNIYQVGARFGNGKAATAIL